MAVGRSWWEDQGRKDEDRSRGKEHIYCIVFCCIILSFLLFCFISYFPYFVI